MIMDYPLLRMMLFQNYQVADPDSTELASNSTLNELIDAYFAAAEQKMAVVEAISYPYVSILVRFQCPWSSTFWILLDVWLFLNGGVQLRKVSLCKGTHSLYVYILFIYLYIKSLHILLCRNCGCCRVWTKWFSRTSERLPAESGRRGAEHSGCR